MYEVYPNRYAPGDSLASQLTFALKYEGLDLLVLKRLFAEVPPKDVAAMVAENPTGSYSRRLWFLYEMLTGREVHIKDASSGNFVDVLNPELQFEGPRRLSSRHRVANNLPGVCAFCPLTRRTAALDAFLQSDAPARARQVFDAAPGQLTRRAAGFLLMKDSKASFRIEGETPPRERLARWCAVLGGAGRGEELSLSMLEELQVQVLGDKPDAKLGLRQEGGFIGTHDASQMPMPEHLSARHQDLPALMAGMMDAEKIMREGGFSPVLTATAVGFGFVFVHPFEDGNGRIHRYLLHHELVAGGYTPRGVVFPVSAAILDQLPAYQDVLEDFSRPRTPLVEWQPTARGNVEVTNETMDLYSYFDATKQAEFFAGCIEATVSHHIPDELRYLERHDAMTEFVDSIVEMPSSRVSLMLSFLAQNKGQFSKRARRKEFPNLTDEHITAIEEKYCATFELEDIGVEPE
jgi:hypothetical protein